MQVTKTINYNAFDELNYFEANALKARVFQ